MNDLAKAALKWKMDQTSKKVEEASADFADDAIDQISEWKMDIKHKWNKMKVKKVKKKTNVDKMRQKYLVKSDKNTKEEEENNKYEHLTISKDPKVNAYLKQLGNYQDEKEKNDQKKKQKHPLSIGGFVKKFKK